ncbi:MAG TPA: hypothetical protein VNF07_02000 [Acidimicrobiales bacterium]|nr:hypothetical protein [Acidimicrobiales bacterium]
MDVDRERVAVSYLQHLTDEDLRLLSSLAGGAQEGAAAAARLRSEPGRVLTLVEGPGAFALAFPEEGAGAPLLPASPFLIFALAVHETGRELSAASYVSEWLGPHHRTPIFEVANLRDFLASPLRRLFLTELLASYTHVSSGSVLVPTRRGLRRRRFSELDPVRLAELLDFVSEAERPGILRRLGDVALFLTGVFPDHTATHGLSELEEGRLLAASGLSRETRPAPSIPGFGDASAVELLERLGRRWYRLAYESLPRPVAVDLRVLGELNERFGDARRILNVLTDRYLFHFRERWFGISGS